MPRVLKVGARILAWVGIEAVPLALLFVIDISFVRYQSAGITWSHHCIFILDLVSIVIFNWLMFPRRGWIQWKNSPGLSALRFNRRRSVKSTMVMSAWLWTTVRGMVAICMVLLLIYAAHPPHAADDQRSIWREDDRKFWQAMRNEGENPLDAGPCYWWGLGCRYLDVRNKWLLSIPPKDLVGPISDGSILETVADIRRFHLDRPNLARRKLRFARFESVYLRGVDLRGAELQGANLARAELQEASLAGAELQGADLAGAKLQGANLARAELQEASLAGAELQGASLVGAELQGANLARAELQGANLARAELQGADLAGAKLQGASLAGAGLQGANLQWARLQGANLREAALQGGKGRPTSWFLTWMPDVSFDFLDSPKQYLQELLSDGIKDIELAWREGLTLKQHLEQSLIGDSKVFDGAEPKDKNMVFHTRANKNWQKALPDVTSDRYWEAWAEWTEDFACENEYTARSSLQRWRSPKRGRGWFRFMKINPATSLGREVPEHAREKIQDAILKASEEPECPGLHALTEDERKWFVDR